MNLILKVILIELLVKTWAQQSNSSLEGWNPFKFGVLYRSPLRYSQRHVVPRAPTQTSNKTESMDNKTQSSTAKLTESTKQMVTLSTTVGTNGSVMTSVKGTREEGAVKWDDILVNVAKTLRRKCLTGENNLVRVGGQMQSGMYCVFMDDMFTCVSHVDRPNHYPVVSFIKEYDDRYLNVQID